MPDLMILVKNTNFVIEVLENLYDDEKNPDVNKLNELQAFQDLYNRHPLIK